MIRLPFYFLLVLSVVGCKSDANLPVWTADVGDKLDAEGPIGFGFSMRPPANHQEHEAAAPGGKGATVISWGSVQRQDDTRSLLTLTIFKPSAKEAIPKLAAIVKNFIGVLETNYDDFSSQPIEYGRINGAKFACQKWSGKMQDSDVEMEGAMWVGVADKIVFQLTTRDLKIHAAETFPVHEAAVFSIRKKE